ncbi:MAG: DUF2442 domain-containing protein [Treponema sp.]|nr:DUF2442 domain-containing protein [Treponema sp.]
MFHAVKTVGTLPDFRLHVFFKNGEEKVYDMRPLMEKNEAFKAFLLTHKLFDQAKVAAGGYGVCWNEDLDISCNELYMNGSNAIDMLS